MDCIAFASQPFTEPPCVCSLASFVAGVIVEPCVAANRGAPVRPRFFVGKLFTCRTYYWQLHGPSCHAACGPVGGLGTRLRRIGGWGGLSATKCKLGRTAAGLVGPAQPRKNTSHSELMPPWFFGN
jgi:hypothetical protein